MADGCGYTPLRGSSCLTSNGPGRKKRLRPSRRPQGFYSNGETFDVTDDWRSLEPNKDELPSGWTGRSIFFVVRGDRRDFGIDQRRQGSTVADDRGHARVSWADLDDSNCYEGFNPRGGLLRKLEAYLRVLRDLGAGRGGGVRAAAPQSGRWSGVAPVNWRPFHSTRARWANPASVRKLRVHRSHA